MPLNSEFKGDIPNFNKDSAFEFIKNQVDFGPRIPNTNSHDSCGIFLENKLKSFGANIISQEAVVYKYDSTALKIKNIIAEFYPEKENRIMLFAHWDSRIYSDFDPDTTMQYKSFDSANDGASGVGVLLEIARHISITAPNVGIDIIFFDAEDQGEHKNETTYNETSWCLGSQYWAKNIHKENYNPLYGISVDMVGAKNAKFSKEDNSRHFSGYLTKQIWKTAENMGYSDYFIDQLTNPVLHDHLFVSKLTDIRTVIIIDYSRNSNYGYNEHWHTQKDNLDNIDKNTLNVVGQTLLQVIYSEK